jgi:hypothetical protein
LTRRKTLFRRERNLTSRSKLPDIFITAIQHRAQRYETPGDYWAENGWMQFRVSKLGNWRYEFLIILHELVEWALVTHAGIPLKTIDDFDKKYEEERTHGLHAPDDEPGWDKDAPYRKQHIFAEKVEKMAARMLGVNWKEYGNKVMNLNNQMNTKADLT